MLNTCPQCGQYRVDKVIEPHGIFANAVCPHCGYKQRFLYQPLFLIAGASGSGKTAICQRMMMQARADLVPLDSDILWRPEFNQPENKYRDFFETWLRLSKNIGQAGKPVALFGAGFGVPENIEPCLERRYFSAIHYLALVCSQAALTQRLQARPAWRESGSDVFIAQQLQYNAWLTEYAHDEPDEMSAINTSERSLDETVALVETWIAGKLNDQTNLANHAG